MDASIWLRGNDLIVKPLTKPEALDKLPFLKREKDKGLYHAKPMYYSIIKKLFPDSKEFFKDDPIWSGKLKTKLQITPRDYQVEAHEAWLKNKKGYIVFVTGAGKTIQAIMAIHELKVPTLVVVPTIDLLMQWKESISKNLDTKDVGILGAGEKDIKPITVATYDSARIHITKLAKFPFVVFDEVHHLPAESNRRIAEGLLSPYRMGLTATPERTDGLHDDLFFLIGEEIIRKGHKELRPYIADFRIEKMSINLSPKETYEYEQNMRIYRGYIGRRRLYRFGRNAYSQLIMRVGRDSEARKALLAHQEARKIALNARKKIEKVLDILENHRDDKVILFSEFNSVVDQISMEYLIPAITYRTKPKERKIILDNFRQGIFTKIVTGRVLDEGVDVPDASVGVIISGTSSERSYIQRLGRLLRPKKTEAVLYELITSGTVEVRSSYRRKLK
jgi:superfamily II DNA or RNA helicase